MLQQLKASLWGPSYSSMMSASSAGPSGAHLNMDRPMLAVPWLAAQNQQRLAWLLDAPCLDLQLLQMLMEKCLLGILKQRVSSNMGALVDAVPWWHAYH